MKRRVGNCPDCSRQVGMTKAGIVVKHNRSRWLAGKLYRVPCSGSGKPERVEE